MDQSKVCVTICPIDAPCEPHSFIFENYVCYSLFNRHSSADYSKWHWPGIFFLRLLPQTLQGFPCVLDSMLLATGCLLVFFVCPRNILMINAVRSICSINLVIFTSAATGIVNRWQWPQFFDFLLLTNFFPLRILVWSCHAETSLSFPIQFDELRVFLWRKTWECCHGLL